MDKCCLHSLTSTGHSTCRQTVKVACWLLTSVIILFCCWAVDYNYNASSSTTQTLKTSCIGQQDYVTVNSHHNSTFYTAVGSGRGLMSSHYSIYAKWLVHCCFTQTHYSNVPVPIAFFCLRNDLLCIEWNVKLYRKHSMKISWKSFHKFLNIG